MQVYQISHDVSEAANLRRWIRDVPDFPKPGILFKDITPLLKDAAAFLENHEKKKIADVYRP